MITINHPHHPGFCSVSGKLRIWPQAESLRGLAATCTSRDTSSRRPGRTPPISVPPWGNRCGVTGTGCHKCLGRVDFLSLLVGHIPRSRGSPAGASHCDLWYSASTARFRHLIKPLESMESVVSSPCLTQRAAQVSSVLQDAGCDLCYNLLAGRLNAETCNVECNEGVMIDCMYKLWPKCRVPYVRMASTMGIQCSNKSICHASHHHVSMVHKCLTHTGSRTTHLTRLLNPKCWSRGCPCHDATIMF